MKNVVRQMFCISKLTLVIDLPILIHSIHDLILHAFVFNLDLFLDLRVRVYFSCLLIYCFLLAALTTFLDDDLFNAQASLNAKITLWVVFYQLGNRLSLGSLVLECRIQTLWRNHRLNARLVHLLNRFRFLFRQWIDLRWHLSICLSSRQLVFFVSVFFTIIWIIHCLSYLALMISILL